MVFHPQLPAPLSTSFFGGFLVEVTSKKLGHEGATFDGLFLQKKNFLTEFCRVDHFEEPIFIS